MGTRMTTKLVQASRLIELGERILSAVGVPADDAHLVSDSLVTAELWGHPSHGLLRLGWYIARLRNGVMTPVSKPAVTVDRGAVAVVDGREGIGQVVAAHACREAVRRASNYGVAAVGVRNSNHFGTAAYFTRMIAREGFIGILTTNGSPAMAPWGGREKAVGANPFSIAAPGGRRGPIVLDIANTAVARGKVYAALERDEPIPSGWAIDVYGAPTTDAQAAIDGLILPMAGHKGYGISFLMDVLSGVLTGSSYGRQVSGPYVPDRRSGCGHLVIALQIEAFMGLADFEHRIDDLIETTKAVPLAQGFGEIFYPGEIEDRAAVQAGEHGVQIPQRTLEQLEQLADSCGLPPTLTDW